VPPFADLIDLDTLQLRPGEGRRVDTSVRLAPLQLGGQEYTVHGGSVDTRLDVSRTVSGGFALRLRFDTPVEGACMRCMTDAAPVVAVDAREVEQAGEAEELHSPYLDDDVVDLGAWARDALVLALPAQIVCSDHCRGLCSVCGANLNEADPIEHQHGGGADPRWAKLRDLKLG
jgi:uncharacterized protein